MADKTDWEITRNTTTQFSVAAPRELHAVLKHSHRQPAPSSSLSSSSCYLSSTEKQLSHIQLHKQAGNCRTRQNNVVFDSGPLAPLSEHMTSSTKPEVDKVLHHRRRRTEPQPQVTGNLVKYERTKRTQRITNRHTQTHCSQYYTLCQPVFTWTTFIQLAFKCSRFQDPLLPFSVLSLWDWPLTWKTVILQCYYTVGWVIWPVKSSLKWPIMCRVGR